MTSIMFRYEKTNRYGADSIEVFANDAQIGFLFGDYDHLVWNPDVKNYNVRFQFRNELTFQTVVKELKRYKTEQGYKYLTITSVNGGFATALDQDMLKRAGFHYLPKMDPSLMFLE